MKYSLTRLQYNHLWYKKLQDNNSFLWDHAVRVAMFKDRFGNKLTYSDSSDDSQAEDFWGMIEGTENDIIWFILQNL